MKPDGFRDVESASDFSLAEFVGNFNDVEELEG